MKNIFLDSGLISEFLTDDSSQTEAITTILTLAEEKRIKVYVSPFLYSDLHKKFNSIYGNDKLAGTLRKLNMIVRTARVNNKIIKQALHSDVNDFRTGLEYFTARGNKKINAIITNDPAAYYQAKIALFTPEIFLTTLWNTNE